MTLQGPKHVEKHKNNKMQLGIDKMLKLLNAYLNQIWKKPQKYQNVYLHQVWKNSKISKCLSQLGMKKRKKCI